MDVEQDLRATSDAMLSMVERLRELEIEKRALPPGTPRFRVVALEVERLAARVYAQTHAQQTLAERTAILREQTGTGLPPIDESNAVREIPDILKEWRGAERRLAAAKPGSARHLKAQADSDRLRAEYRRAYETTAQAADDDRQT